MKKKMAGLFDLDGVIFDTEYLYTVFWSEQGKWGHPEIPDFSSLIKGRTLKEILQEYFPDTERATEIVSRIDDFERHMSFEYIPGVLEFIKSLKANGVKLAIVTSSNDEKMKNAYRAHPELPELFDLIVTADKVTYSKPNPECYLTAATELKMKVGECIVFEDSYSGLEAGRCAGMKVVGLATTNPAEKISDKADVVIPDFCRFTFTDFESLLK